MNSVQLIGRLTHDPHLDRTATGSAVATFRLAVDRPGREGADFLTVKTWNRVAEASAAHLRRGRRVAVEGRLEHQEWTDAGDRRLQRLIVVAGRVEFLDASAVDGEPGSQHTDRAPASKAAAVPATS